MTHLLPSKSSTLKQKRLIKKYRDRSLRLLEKINPSEKRGVYHQSEPLHSSGFSLIQNSFRQRLSRQPDRRNGNLHREWLQSILHLKDLIRSAYEYDESLRQPYGHSDEVHAPSFP